MWYDIIVILWLKIRLKITQLFHYYTNLFVDVIGINNNNTLNVTYRYYCVVILKYLISILEYLIKLVDLKCDKIQIRRKVKETDIYLILDKSYCYNKTLTIPDICNYLTLQNETVNTIPLGNIVLEINLHTNNNRVNIKDICNRYTESKVCGHHTFKNVMKFNNISYDNLYY